MLCVFDIYDSFIIGKNLKPIIFVYMVNSLRGGNYNNGTNAGIFNFNAWNQGNANSDKSFRLVMSPSL